MPAHSDLSTLSSGLREDVRARTLLGKKNKDLLALTARLAVLGPFPDGTASSVARLVNNPEAISLIDALCNAVRSDVRQLERSEVDQFSISYGSWTALEKLWIISGLSSDDWRAFKQDSLATGLTWNEMLPVLAAQLVAPAESTSRRGAMLNASLGEQMRKMAAGANPNIRVPTGAYRDEVDWGFASKVFLYAYGFAVVTFVVAAFAVQEAKVLEPIIREFVEQNPNLATGVVVLETLKTVFG
jgi:hypothetical protein